MGIGVNIFGYIDCPGYGWQRKDQRIFRHNRRVIEHLPVSDSEWPCITKTMFSMLPLRTNLDVCIPQYENQLIHFAGAYKNMYLVDAAWLTKFEAILGQLCWYSATVINGFSRIEYHWEVDLSDTDRYRDDPPRPPIRWSFEIHSLERGQLAFKDGIDGTFQSVHHVSSKGVT